jgi:hypothetical protein
MSNILIPEHVFISYSHHDEKLAKKITTELEKVGIPIWIDRSGLQPGTPNWNNTIRHAISRSYAVLLVASPNSGQSSIVQGELNLAHSNGCPIYPVWIAGKWEDSVPLSLLYSQYIDCREGQFTVGLSQIVEILNKVYADLPKHFALKLTMEEFLKLSIKGYLFIKLDKEVNVVGLRPSSYQSLRALLDDLYLNYLKEKYQPFTYGQDWIITTNSGGAERLLMPSRKLCNEGKEASR